MTILDDKLVPATLKLIQKLGIPARLIHYCDEYNPETGKKEQNNIKISDTKMSPPQFKKITSGEDYADSGIAFCTPQLLDFPPSTGMFVEFTGAEPETYKIFNVRPLRSGDQIAAYQLWLGEDR